MNKTKAVFGIAITSAVMFLVGCGESKISSRWSKEAVSVDGLAKEWSMDNAEENSGFAVSVSNDAKNLYLAVAPNTRSAKMLLSSAFERNLTIWIDPLNTKAKDMAIKFAPLKPKDKKGKKSSRPNFGGDQPPSMENSGETPPRNFENGDMTSDDIRVSTGIIELVGFDSDNIASVADGQGIEIKLGNVNRRGILEARIPLAVLGNSLPKEISLGFEAESFGDIGGEDKERRGGPRNGAMGRGMGGPPPGGGFGGAGGPPQGGAMPGGRGNGQGGSPTDNDDNSPLDLWLRITLAEQSIAPKN